MQDGPAASNASGWRTRIEPRLAAQLDFLIEADRLKTIIRGSRIADGSRRENTAEHSWHLALFAMILSEWATGPVDVFRVVQMLILHDLVEIECGDTPLLDQAGSQGQAEREAAAAAKLFALLPQDQGPLMHALWDEFERAQSADARFAKALDRLQPILLNHLVGGGTWLDYQVDVARETSLTRRIADGAPMLWTAAEHVYAEAVQMGWLRANSDDCGS